MHSSGFAAQSPFAQRMKNHIKQSIVRAKRRGAWFSLDRREKSILYLSVRLQLRFESLELLRSLASILKKLEVQGETMLAWLRRGTRLAWSFSEFAVACGNRDAKAWRNDRAYALFLGRFNSSTRLGVRT